MAGAPDPDLQPVAAAQAFLAGQQPATRRAPVITPADPAGWSTQVTLTHPLLVDGERLDTITVRRLTVGDIARLNIETDDEQTLNLMARAAACGLDPAVWQSLSADDGLKLEAVIRPFLPAALVQSEEALLAALDGEPTGAA
jgi:hypothetical protein